MGKAYRAVKEHYDYGTIIGSAYSNLFHLLATAEKTAKKWKEVEDILDAIWSSLPSLVKRKKYKERGDISYWEKWEKEIKRWQSNGSLQEKTEIDKRRVLSKMQILSDLLYNEQIWIRSIVVDIFDEKDYELIRDEEIKEMGGPIVDED